MNNPTVYFDNAATTFPKPQSVLSSTIECLERYCGNAGRGSHLLAMRSAEAVFDARDAVAELFGASPENAVFTLNTTYALNMAIKGIMASGGHVLISNMEHNSTLRPVAKLASQKKITYDVFEAYSSSRQLSSKDVISNIVSKLRADTKMVICVHSSNICSYSLPIGDIGKFCKRHGLIFLVDAAQSAGHMPINMQNDGIDILCMPAHKGLYAPQGLGIMLLGEGVRLETLIEGGNGVNSLDIGMGKISPERYEGGTLCTPAIAGLCAGIKFIQSLGTETISGHEEALWRRMYANLSSLSRIRIYDEAHVGSILLFNVEGKDPDDVGRYLSQKGFCLRTGYHCSPLAHKALGTSEGGALRASFSLFNTDKEVDMLCEAIRGLCEA